ncbi:MAG: aminotransferase class I/II-fold pyridoxal phosphate-dependent enzyme [Spirochaetales bacterium]|nr:aminotransferase class I/II-fold pyridoxal phosphate-dependent enzyme [Spirochaetales bacterium]
MHPLAEELNAFLAPTVVGRTLTKFGRRIYFPRGIVAQSAEAKKSATTFNATVGIAMTDGEPMILPTIQDNLPRLSPSEATDYAPTGGDARLRTLWKTSLIAKNPQLSEDQLSLPAVVPGITAGISLAADLFIDEDDCVVFSDLCWDNYPLIFDTRAQAHCATFSLFTPENKLNVKGIVDTLRSNARRNKAVLVLNFPHNPTGYTPTETEARDLAQQLTALAAEGLNLVVFFDDAYFGLFYEKDVYKHSLFNLLYNAHENLLAVKLDGATKEDYVWGFRVAFLTLAAKGLSAEHFSALDQKILGTIRTVMSNSSRVGQTLLYKELSSLVYHGIKDKFAKVLEERYRSVRALVATAPAVLRPLPFNSGYFMTFELLKGDAEVLRKELLRTEGIGTIALQGHYLRIAYSSVDNRDLSELYTTIFAVAARLFSA